MSDQSSNTPMPAGNGALKRTGRSSRGRIRRPSWSDIAAFLVKRYGALPAWVLLVQIFLAAGWMRAAAAHGLSLEWWSGREVAAFRVEHSETAIDWYRLTILNGPVSWAPVAIAGIVIVGQLTVGALLGSHYRPLMGLGIGAFLNINFVLAGAVDPSAFYLVIAAAIALWHIEAGAGAVTCWWLTLGSTVVGFTFIGSLAPEITTVDPALVIDDPAMVLTFVTLLWILSLWLTLAKRTFARSARRAGAAVNSVDESAWRRSPARLEGGEPESFSDVARRATGTGDIDAEAGVPDVSSAVRIHPPPEHRRDR